MDSAHCGSKTHLYHTFPTVLGVVYVCESGWCSPLHTGIVKFPEVDINWFFSSEEGECGSICGTGMASVF